jgi:hypothetical protein
MKRIQFAWLLLIALGMLSGCQSEAARDAQYKAEADRKVAEDEQQREGAVAHSEAVTALELEKQNQLDAVEQRRSGNVYAHSCRKAVGFDPSMPVSVDTKGCTPEQLRLELDAERRQMFDDALKNSKENQKN